MKIVQINAVCGKGSTGKICKDISIGLTEKGIENYILYSSGNSDFSAGIKTADDRYLKLQSLKARLFGNWGFNSHIATKNIISNLNKIKPDIVHLHNIHGHDCNLEKLFKYFKSSNTKVIWTFHDCWAFTGYCMHFVIDKCDKWKTQCEKCPQKKPYSWIFDNSKKLHNKKKKLFTDVDLTVVTPSKWLAKLTKESFLKSANIKVINNGIELSLFKPTKSDFRKKHSINDKHIVLGIAFGWGYKKGLDVFIELSKRLDENYQIVLVGTNDDTDRLLPDNIISIHRTQDQSELAEIYSAADVFVNPTRQDTFPTVNIEALACGTPIVTFNTGGSPEIIDKTCGISVEPEDIETLIENIEKVCSQKPFSKESCTERAQKFSRHNMVEEYLKLYGEQH